MNLDAAVDAEGSQRRDLLKVLLQPEPSAQLNE